MAKAAGVKIVPVSIGNLYRYVTPSVGSPLSLRPCRYAFILTVFSFIFLYFPLFSLYELPPHERDDIVLSHVPEA